MKKKAAIISAVIIILAIIGMIAFGVYTSSEAYHKKMAGEIVITEGGTEKRVDETMEGNLKTYCRIEDGTWFCDGLFYQYRLEISNASNDTVFVYLSNLSDISFEQAWKALGLSSNTEDYFALEDAILVEMDTK